MEFVESKPFTRKLHQLAGDRADQLLRAIQGDLRHNPDRGAMVPGLGGVRKPASQIRAAAKENVADSAICTSSSTANSEFIC